MTRTVVAVALLLVLAGCTGIVDDDATPGGGTPTLSPGGDSPTATPTPGDGYPPGVSESGLENATALIQAHDEAVTQTGFRSELVTTVGYADANSSIPPATLTYEATVSAGGYPYLFSETNAGGLSQDYVHVTWANESVQVANRTAATAAGEPDSHYEMKEPAPPGADGPAMVLNEFVAPGEYDRVEEADDRLTFRATSVETGAFDRNVTSYDGELVVDRRGRIREATVELVFDEDGTTIEANLTYELDVGDVDVQKPDWVETAIHEATAHTVEASVEGDYVALTNTGREPIQPGFTIALAERSENGWSGPFAEVDEPIEPGETVYLSYDGPHVVVDRSQPDDPDPLSGTYRITVTDEDFDRVATATVEADDD